MTALEEEKSSAEQHEYHGLQLTLTQTQTTDEEIDSRAIGGDSAAALPKNYFRSSSFLGTMLGFGLGYQATYIFFVMQSILLYPYISPAMGNPPNIVWVTLSSIVAQTAIFPVVGRLSDIFGRRYFFLCGNALSVVGNLICSRAVKSEMLIAGQTLAGLATCCQQTCTSALPELVPNKHRFIAVSFLWAWLFPLMVFIPPVGIALCSNINEGWRWIYYLPAIMAGLAFILLFFFYHPPDFRLLHRNQTKWQALARIDWVGLGIYLGSIVCFLLGISWGGQQYPWGSPRVIATICVGPVGFASFLLWGKFVPAEGRLIPFYLFKNRDYVAFAITGAVGSMIFYALNVVYGQETTNLFGASQRKSGWYSLAITAGAPAGQLLGGALTKPLGHTRLQLIATCVTFTSLIGGMAGVTRNTPAMSVAFTTISAIMIGYMEVVSQVGAPMVAKDKDIGVAYAVVAAFRTLMSALATSIYVTILQNQLTQNVPKYVVPAAVQAGLPKESVPNVLQAIASGVESNLEAVPGVDAAVLVAVGSAVKTAYEVTFKVIFLVSIVFGAISIAAACTARDLDPHMTSSISRRLQHVPVKVAPSQEE
ncbi:uncharacterized protein Z519_08621 [Cladophialophora bantiana CBS 173.52]|uniref:Major facilitator superfamily (MFS) profile domain-containing protein n=1 Tax=Cladophialophora bantiana (strain ATCC 10958 / CBS 173.52 / CDC B-1940 / NIH 8579) TaxID=1442370 RepID=A0A0D2HC16_CLAB1|nr:uncharacterized protein Z519_08621 [Cladophialophora bantiana CBS 173.52]KIW90838.1 hypothetical protein Z519_08621 [Cladophialophora bantiana CBS 173.52]